MTIMYNGIRYNNLAPAGLDRAIAATLTPHVEGLQRPHLVGPQKCEGPGIPPMRSRRAYPPRSESNVVRTARTRVTAMVSPRVRSTAYVAHARVTPSVVR